MAAGKYIPPTLNSKAFNCVECGVFAKLKWCYMQMSSGADGFGTIQEDDRFRISHCENCGYPTNWYAKTMVYPRSRDAEPPADDMPDLIKGDYEEARDILQYSPRGAAALLRLAIQKLYVHLGESGKSINDDIQSLVAKGLPPKVQQALDVIRVVGNESVHPGTIDLRDN